MADQGIWFKLHCSALDDPDLDNLEIGDFGRWAKLGTFTKRHGTGGTIHLAPPARALCAALQVPDFEALMMIVERFPHVTVRRDNSAVSLVTSASVTFDNWARYQGDFSSPRVSKFREMKRSKRRREEKRGEERKTPPPTSPPTDWKLNAELEEAVRQGRFRDLAGDEAWWTAQFRAFEIRFAEEVQKADAWCRSNPGRAPRRELRRFLHTWFSRAAERGANG